MSTELNKICSLLDKLTVEVFILMERYIQSKIELEKVMSDGEAHLAKSRYIMGGRNVSSLQLPTEESPEVQALATVVSVEDDKLFGQKSFDLVMQKKLDGNDSFQDPLKWFGVLVPQDLQKAQAKFRQSVLMCVQSVNLQTQLYETCIKLKQVQEYKLALLNTHEE